MYIVGIVVGGGRRRMNKWMGQKIMIASVVVMATMMIVMREMMPLNLHVYVFYEEMNEWHHYNYSSIIHFFHRIFIVVVVVVIIVVANQFHCYHHHEQHHSYHK
jgi:multisubunit Na+/H+ antiporter MnhB subunit